MQTPGSTSGRPRRERLFKCRLSLHEERVIAERARGYPSPAEYGRRLLVAGWALPVRRLSTVADSFIPIQRAIDLAAAAGHAPEATAATDALRRIFATVSEP